MSLSFMTLGPIIGLAVLSLLFLVYRMHRESSQHISELEFFLKQRTISHNKERARLSVFKTKYAKLNQQKDELEEKLLALKDREAEFEKAILRNDILERKNAEFEKLGHEIINIQEMLNGNIKKQLANYMKEVDGISKRLHRATYEFSENTKSFEFLESQDVA